MAWLRIVSHRGAGSTFDVGERTFTVGRSPGNFVQLLAHDVSRRHCQIAWNGSNHEIRDLNSQNGLLVNGQRVPQQVLADNDLVTIGVTVLQYHAGSCMPGAVDHAQRWKEVRAEITGSATMSLDPHDLSGILRSIQDGVSLPDAPRTPSTIRPVPAPPTTAGVFPEDGARRFLEHLRTPGQGTTMASFLGEVASGAGRLMYACRVTVLMRRVGPNGSNPHLKPVLTWVRPELEPGSRGLPVLGEVMKRAVVENVAVGAMGRGPGTPTCALAAPIGLAGAWYGVLYADSFGPTPGPFRQPHLEFLAAMAGRTAEFLATLG